MFTQLHNEYCIAVAPADARSLATTCLGGTVQLRLPTEEELMAMYTGCFGTVETGHKAFQEAMSYAAAGRKPKPGDTDVVEYPIPESNYRVRIWCGGLRDQGECFFDFTENGRAVNTPSGFKITNVPDIAYADTFIPQGGELMSVEVEAGLDHIPEGYEKYMATQGTRYRIDRPNQPSVSFETPRYGPTLPPPFPVDKTVHLVPSSSLLF
ncbi:hypothetical protein BOTBODRAFT_71194 [Botryobasidium botryosum FD-172 SS1]|uniref:Uncharacterized protein n=1 Tax=Botryobasidium botryosum (strain FD-172 SS1) TaxID=930990 RepID=A0A067LQY9_BOTB1|nr:hypothetical protein BOTBODRAFT_71194 [Botryobasidium botryosum FD-172 SS1]